VQARRGLLSRLPGLAIAIALLAPPAAVMALPGDAQAQPRSAITAVEVVRTQPVGVFGGIAFRRIEGVIHGEVAASEPVAGLREVAAGRALVPYETRFDLILPEDPALADGVVVEAANRGMRVLPAMLSAPGAMTTPPGEPKAGAAATVGDGFLPAQRLSLAHVQWQTGIAASAPQAAQGVGEVIVRDFGRWLGGAFPATRADAPVFRHRILSGVSQSAWLVNSLIAEGFNVDPQTGHGVYQGAFTRNGNGVVLAINRFAGGKPQFPYAPPDEAPLTPAQLLSRPDSDPVLVDVSSLTDYYRVRASVFARAPGLSRLHRYATAAPHAPGALPAAMVFGTMKCNGGQAVPLNTVSDALYLRALLLGLADAIGAATAAPHRLPPDAPFVLEPAPAELENINRLEGATLWVPRNGPDGAPAGGVRMLEAALPLGAADPPSLPPVTLRSINETCGNFSGWRGFTADDLGRRYGSRADYMARARRQAAELVKAGYLLAADEAAAIQSLEKQLPADFR
jgi:hypothetical protein